MPHILGDLLNQNGYWYNAINFTSTGTPTITSSAAGANDALVINATGGTSGNLLDLQLGGVNKAYFNNTGSLFFTGSSGTTFPGGSIYSPLNDYVRLTATDANGGGFLLNNTRASTSIAFFQSASSTKSYVDFTGSYIAGSSTYGPTSASVNGAINATGPLNTDSGNTNGLGLQINGKNIVYSDGGGSNGNLYLVQPATTNGFTTFFGYAGNATVFGSVSNSGFKTGSSTYGPTSATVNGTINATGATFQFAGSPNVRLKNTNTSGADVAVTAGDSGFSPNSFYVYDNAGAAAIMTLYQVAQGGHLVLPTAGAAFKTGSSIYGSTSASVNGNITLLAQGAVSSSLVIQNGAGSSIIKVDASNNLNIGWNGVTNTTLDTAGNLTIPATFKASGTVAGTPTSQTVAGYVAPTYTAAGASVAGTLHSVVGNITAVGTSTTVTLTGPAIFTNSNSYVPIVLDTAIGQPATITAITASSFTFTSTASRVYNYVAYGT